MVSKFHARAENRRATRLSIRPEGASDGLTRVAGATGSGERRTRASIRIIPAPVAQPGKPCLPPGIFCREVGIFFRVLSGYEKPILVGYRSCFAAWFLLV